MGLLTMKRRLLALPLYLLVQNIYAFTSRSPTRLNLKAALQPKLCNTAIEQQKQCHPSSDYDFRRRSTASARPHAYISQRQSLRLYSVDSTVDIDSAEVEESTVPSLKQLVTFVGATMLIWLSEPFLSLIDTLCVSITQGGSAVTQLASLGPATTLIDSTLYLTYFLAIATTNLISRGLALQDYKKLQETTSHVLGVATVLGLITSLFTWSFGPRLLKSMAGLSGSPELLTYAYHYASIRAIAGVSSVLGMVSQSFLLANLDTKTCAKAVLAASSVNLVGDIGLARWGVRGAAVATAASSIISCVILMRAVGKKMGEWRKLELLERKRSTVSSEEDEDSDDIPLPKTPLLSLPDKKSFLKLLTLSGPIFFVILSKVACYSAMTLRITDYGVAALATHSLMYRVFFVFGTFGDAISQAAQSFMPSALIPRLRKDDFRTILRRLLITAAVIGTLNSQLSIWILQNLGGYLTKDATIISMLKEHAGWLGTALIVHPLILIFEGTVTAARDFRTLLATYTATLGIHFSMLRFFCDSFPAVWRTFLVFQVIRLSNFAFHVWKKQRVEEPNGKLVGKTSPA